ncbi:diguanylate phosphodiesterase [Alicyclobacillus hesperidum URH17-3-68]|uniref:EAL domain-containing protein n=1 Tax=Alicyclobacillus hesperidum TaxID=89784 RepID=UPI000281B610|nr:EAL domain-containing protein [Alicyclobacillus hesperidum]EJY55732.1 diguanylate phosphodiesterase [Alicyclobacillus hesperidum URH17-3-68]
MSCEACAASPVRVVLRIPESDLTAVRASLGNNAGEIWLGGGMMSLPPEAVTARIRYWQEFFDTSLWAAGLGNNRGLGTEELQPFDVWAQGLPPVWLDELLARGGLRMAIQPIVDVGSGSIVACEMLVRAVSAAGDFISPGALFQAARDQSRLFALDRACRIEAIAAATQLPSDWYVFINFVPTSIYVPEHCLRSTVEATRKHGLAKSRLVFEVVETELVEDLEHLRRILDFYRREGWQYALDDFGEGYSDETMLRAIQPDVVKLDRQFVDHVDADPAKRRVAEGLAQVAKSLGVRLLAEGVERPQEALLLRDLGYLWQQGYLYGRPTFDVPVEHINWR